MNEGTKSIVITAFLILCLVLVMLIPAHCAVSTKHVNSLGTVMYDTNPLMYMVGSLATDKAVTEVDGNLNLRIKPLGTYMLYDESILFCGMPVDKFQGITEPFVLTYRRQANRSVQGIGCHELLKVNSLKETKLQ